MRRCLGLALLLGLGCQGGGCDGGKGAATPEGAVQQLLAAASTGDRAGVYARLGPATQARIEKLLQASRKTSGRLAMKPEDFLSVGWAPPAWEPAGMRTLQKSERAAIVEVYAQSGDRHTVELVRESRVPVPGEEAPRGPSHPAPLGEWKVELPGR